MVLHAMSAVWSFNTCPCFQIRSVIKMVTVWSTGHFVLPPPHLTPCAEQTLRMFCDLSHQDYLYLSLFLWNKAKDYQQQHLWDFKTTPFLRQSLIPQAGILLIDFAQVSIVFISQKSGCIFDHLVFVFVWLDLLVNLLLFPSPRKHTFF